MVKLSSGSHLVHGEFAKKPCTQLSQIDEVTERIFQRSFIFLLDILHQQNLNVYGTCAPNQFVEFTTEFHKLLLWMSSR
jgi:hypothetical protein